jgi:segregation and condensation protein B
MTTPPPIPPAEGRPAGPDPVPEGPATGPTGGGIASRPDVVAGSDPQPESELEAEAGSGAGPDAEGGRGSAARPDDGGGAGSTAAPDAAADRGTGPGPDAHVDAGPAGTPLEAGGSGTGSGSAAEGLEGDPTAWPPDEAFDGVGLDDRGWTRRDLEAILLVADEPVPAVVLAEIVGARLSEVEELLVDLAGEYARDGRGFVLRAIAGGWRLYTNPGATPAVEAYLRAGQQSRLTRAALETLAVIAYRQPVTRFQVAAVRGVNVDGVFRTLASRGLIQEVGTDPGPGQATLYSTTPAFLEQLGLNDLDQLPPIKDYLPEGVDLLDLQEQP